MNPTTAELSTTLNSWAEIASSKEFVAASVQAAASLAQALATVLAVWLAYHFAMRQLRQQQQQQVQQDLRRRRADALEQAWALLQDLSPNANTHSLLSYEQSPGIKGEEHRHYSLHLHRAQAFVFERLPHTFYASGAGLHWPPEVKDQFFHCRGIVYGILLAEKQAHPPPHPTPTAATPTPINNPKAAQALVQNYQTLNALLRQAIEQVYEQANSKKSNQNRQNQPNG